MKDDEIKQILIDSIQNQKQNFKDLKNLFLAVVIAFTIIICSMIAGFLWYENQFDYGTTEETTKEIITSGDDADANLIEGDQYNDNAQHTE